MWSSLIRGIAWEAFFFLGEGWKELTETTKTLPASVLGNAVSLTEHQQYLAAADTSDGRILPYWQDSCWRCSLERDSRCMLGLFVQISIRASCSSSSFPLLLLLLSLLLLLLHVVVRASLSRRHLSQEHHYILTESCRNAHYDTFAGGKLLREVDLLVGSSLDELDVGDGVSGFDHVCDR